MNDLTTLCLLFVVDLKGQQQRQHQATVSQYHTPLNTEMPHKFSAAEPPFHFAHKSQSPLSGVIEECEDRDSARSLCLSLFTVEEHEKEH